MVVKNYTSLATYHHFLNNLLTHTQNLLNHSLAYACVFMTVEMENCVHCAFECLHVRVCAFTCMRMHVCMYVALLHYIQIIILTGFAMSNSLLKLAARNDDLLFCSSIISSCSCPSVSLTISITCCVRNLFIK